MPHIVAVVLHAVDHDLAATSSVGRTRAALNSQTRAPDSVVELSSESYAGAQDLSRSLRSALLRDRRQARRTLSPGPAGSRSTELWRHLERKLPDGFGPRHQWLWILPEGSVPSPDALAQLEERLFTVKDEETHQKIQIIGAKQAHADHPERLVDVGLWRGGSGEVLSLTEPKELDQGQYDGRDEVPAVSADGMLVHAPLFGDLGGFDPALDAEYAAARLCSRAREVGAHIVIEPSAQILREEPPRRDEVHRLGGSLYLPAEQRRSQIRSRLAAAHPLALPFLWVGMWCAALLRLLGLTALKAPDAGIGQFLSAGLALVGWGVIAHTRSFRVQGRRAVLARLTRDEQIEDEKAVVGAGRAADRALQLSSEQLRAHRRRLLSAETVVHGRSGIAEKSGDEEHEESLLAAGDADGEFDEMPSRGSGDRLVLFLVLLALTGLSLLAFRGLLTAEALTGGAALPVSESLGEVWRSALSFIAPQGIGERAAADPFTLILLLLSAVSFGHASTVLVWLVVLTLPLAALTAWYAAGTWTATASTRIVAALLWTAVPALHVALGEGRIGVVLVHVLLPLTAAALVPTAGWRRAAGGSWEHATGAALLVAVLTASAPALLPLAVLAPVSAAVVLGRRGRPLWLVPLPSLALAAPMLASALSADKNLLAVVMAEPTRALGWQEWAGPAPLWQQLLGHSQAFDPAAGLTGAQFGGALPEYFAGDFWALRLALVIGAPLLLVALLGMFAATLSPSTPGAGGGGLYPGGAFHRSSALAAGMLLLAALVFSFALGQVAVAEDGRTLIPGNPAPLVSVVAFCLLIAVVGTLDRLPQALPRIGASAIPITSTLLVLSVIASLGFWALPRVLPSAELGDQPLTAMSSERTLVGAGSVRGIPATAADQGQGPAQTRTLVLKASDQGVIAELVSGQGLTLETSRSVVTAGDVPLWARPASVPELLGGTRGSDPADAPPAAQLSTGEARLAELVAAIVTPGSEEAGELMQELGVAHVLLPGGEGALADVVDTASGLTAVGPTDRGMLWHASAEQAADVPHASGLEGASTAWARIVDGAGEPVALLPAQDRRVDVALEELQDADGAGLELDSEQTHYVELATERANGWRAHLDGEELETVREPLPGEGEETEVWLQRFELPHTGWTQLSEGQLTAEHRSPYHVPVLIAVGGFLLLVALIAVPLPRGARLLPVASDAELAVQSGAEAEAGGDGPGRDVAGRDA